MKLKQPLTIIVFLTMVAVVGCSIRSNELTTNVDTLVVDTIKNSPKGTQRTYEFKIKGDDEGGNIKSFTVAVNNAVVMVDGEDVTNLIVKLEQSGERYSFTRTVEVIPSADGLHAITVTQRNAFNQVTSLEKRLYSFTNMLPKVGVTYTVDSVRGDYSFDFTTSHDRDQRWGGALDSLFIKGVFHIASTDVDSTWLVALDVKNQGLTHTETILNDDTERLKKLSCWVKDNEGAISDTVHFSIGHAEATPTVMGKR